MGWGWVGWGVWRSLRLRLNSAEAEAEALLGLAELGNMKIFIPEVSTDDIVPCSWCDNIFTSETHVERHIS